MGAATLVALILLLPLVDTMPESILAARITAYALVLVPISLLLHGFFVAAGGYATSRLLALGAVSAALGLSSAFLARPEDLESGSGVFVLLALSFADLSRILAAACVGIALARYITSVGVVLIIVFAAIASDLFSVFAGPTRVLVQEDSPVLDGLLLVFPTFGSALGFGLGVSDFIFLALFAAAGPLPEPPLRCDPARRLLRRVPRRDRRPVARTPAPSPPLHRHRVRTGQRRPYRGLAREKGLENHFRRSHFSFLLR